MNNQVQQLEELVIRTMNDAQQHVAYLSGIVGDIESASELHIRTMDITQAWDNGEEFLTLPRIKDQGWV